MIQNKRFADKTQTSRNHRIIKHRQKNGLHRASDAAFSVLDILTTKVLDLPDAIGAQMVPIIAHLGRGYPQDAGVAILILRRVAEDQVALHHAGFVAKELVQKF